jgi:hypothetical protein
MYRLEVYFGECRMPGTTEYEPPCHSAEYETKQAARDAATDMLASGYRVEHAEVEYYFPPSSILFMKLEEV